MINLLPPEEKKELLLKNKERLVIILGITAFVSLICMILILLSINFYILTEVVFQENVLEQTEKSYKTPVFLSFQSSIKKYNNTITKLNYFYKQEASFSQILKIISSVQRPEGLYFTDISLDRNNENKNIKAVISGFSVSREDLLVFKKNIEESTDIKNPYFSPESWTNPQNVRFYLTFEIYKNEN